MSEALEQRFETFKKSIKIKKYGIQWEKDRKNFSVDYRNGIFQNLGSWDFFPTIHQNHFDQNNLKNIGISKKKNYTAWE